MYNTYYKIMTPGGVYYYLRYNKPQDKELDYDNLFFLPISDLYTEIYRTIMYSTPYLENIILKDSLYIYYYAKDILKSRWVDGEKILLESKNPGWLYEYVKYIIKDRWLEAENIILESKDSWSIYYYAKDVIKGRWPEAESIILNSSYCEDYKRSFNIL